MMPARSQNLLETYYNDGNDTYHYNSLRSDEADEDTFNVKFTRTVSASGIAVNITEITGNFANIDTAKDTAAASGYEFKSLFYQSGYFVFGCTELKLFYDQG